MHLQGPPWLSALSKLALTDRNMNAKITLKIDLDLDIFGTTTIFKEMLTVCPQLDQMSVSRINFIFCPHFA